MEGTPHSTSSELRTRLQHSHPRVPRSPALHTSCNQIITLFRATTQNKPAWWYTHQLLQNLGFLFKTADGETLRRDEKTDFPPVLSVLRAVILHDTRILYQTSMHMRTRGPISHLSTIQRTQARPLRMSRPVRTQEPRFATHAWGSILPA